MKRINNHNEKLEYDVEWFIGAAKRRGWPILLPLLERHPQSEAIKRAIKQKCRISY